MTASGERDPVLRAVDALSANSVARPVAYHIAARLDDARTLSCETQLTVETTRRARRLPLLLHPDLRVSRAAVDGAVVKAERFGDLLWLDLAAPVAAGRRVTVEVQYAGRLPEGLVLQERKACWVELHPQAFWYPWVEWTWDLSVVADFTVECRLLEGMIAVSNLPGRGASSRGRWRWESTTPCTDIAIFAGPYVASARRRAGVRGYVRPDMAERLPALVAQAGAIAAHYSACYGEAPGTDLDLVVPPQSMGGNWGREGLVVAALMRPDDPARNFSILTHELAHRWWALGVRFDFQTDLWLVEGLTQFSALRARLTLRGEKALRDRLGTMPGYQEARRTRIPLSECRPDSPCSEHLREDGGAVFLTQLRLHLGPPEFDRRLRRFYQEHTGTTATAADFSRAMLAGAPPGADAFLHTWITKPLPDVTLEQVLSGLR